MTIEQADDIKRFRGVCTWGDGPDVLLIDETVDASEWKDLTWQQAHILARQLEYAAQKARELEEGYLEACRQREEEGPSEEVFP